MRARRRVGCALTCSTDNGRRSALPRRPPREPTRSPITDAARTSVEGRIGQASKRRNEVLGPCTTVQPSHETRTHDEVRTRKCAIPEVWRRMSIRRNSKRHKTRRGKVNGDRPAEPERATSLPIWTSRPLAVGICTNIARNQEKPIRGCATDLSLSIATLAHLWAARTSEGIRASNLGSVSATLGAIWCELDLCRPLSANMP